MPAQKRPYENGSEDLQEDDKENRGDEEEEGGEDSDRTDNSSSTGHESDEFILVRLSDIRKEVQCPICLGIIKKTRTVMECLHRFCRECIDKSMRLGNNECPACRTHCASRRSLRDDPNYDALIAALYPDIDQYEEEELAFHEEEKARNKQFPRDNSVIEAAKLQEFAWKALGIQASIAQTLKRQSEALGKKRRRSHGNTRRRRNYQSEEEDDANVNDSKDSSSADEQPTGVRMKRPKRCRGQPSSAAGEEKDYESNKESGIGSGGLVGTSEMLAWGRGGMRSHTRYGSGSGGNSKHARNSRLAKLVDHLRNLDENDNELDIHLVLVSVDEQKVADLEQPYLCCRPSLSVGQLCEYICNQTPLRAEEVEILAVKELQSKRAASKEGQVSGSDVLNQGEEEFQLLDFHETLTQVKEKCFCSRGYLVLAYRQKLQ